MVTTLKDIRLKMLNEIKSKLEEISPENHIFILLQWFNVSKLEDIETDKKTSPHPLYEYVKEILEREEKDLQCLAYDENNDFNLRESRICEFIRMIFEGHKNMLYLGKDRINVENQINNNLDTLSIPKVIISEIKCYLLGYHI